MAANTRVGGRRAGLTAHGLGPILFALVGVVLAILSVLRSLPSPSASGPRASASPSPAQTVDPASFLLRRPRPAPRIELTASSGASFSLASQRGHDTLVFFGYTHCPDVCPATVGIVGEALRTLAATGAAGRQAVFVTIDPQRDTVSWLAQYAAYLPAGFTAVTGTEPETRATADAWGVRYARVAGASATTYSMSHTADVFLVDARGWIRADFPFGTSADAIATTVAAVDASPPVPSGAGASAAVSPPQARSPSPAGPLALAAQVVSSTVWSGPPSPVILRLTLDGRPLDDLAADVRVAIGPATGSAASAPVPAIAVRPPGVTAVSYVATVAFPSTGWWRLFVTATLGSVPLSTTIDVAVADPGSTAAVGTAAPAIRTPTISDTGGDIRAVTTDPAPDPRLSTTSTGDALAAHEPFVLVIDSTRFRVTSACGKAIVLARYLLDRWPNVAFIHLEPYRYSVVTDTPVLDGSLDDPPLTDPAAAWGIGGDPWGARSMPWIFVVDGNGIVRAKDQGVIGSDDVDVILAMLAGG